MSGFEANIINLIADNLRDRYDSGFPVLKELIQNADDAGATRFNFGHHPGFGQETSHPLLAGSALWFFNDGRFKQEDVRAIRSFGINSKAGDSSTIGKFGLGMKSVFHLVEAFLYVGMPENESPECQIINPWDNGDAIHLHHDWDNIDKSDWERLELLAKIQRTDASSTTGFFLWLPLRTSRLLNGKGPIIPCFPSEPGSHELDFLRGKNLATRLAGVLAMLPNLVRITCQSPDPDTDFALVVNAEPASDRLKLGSNVERISSHRYWVEGSHHPLNIAARHDLANDTDEYFAKIKASPTWPKSFARNPNTGEEELKRDKSQPEGAVVISHIEGESGKLVMEWALFLPLENHAIELNIPGSAIRYRITLHGQFFVDAGRKGIFGFDDWFDHPNTSPDVFDESALRRAWNKGLIERVILPMLLPALAHYCESWAIKHEQIEQLSNAIEQWLGEMRRKTRCQNFIEMVCQSCVWVRVLNPKGATWSLLAGDKRLLPIPRPPKSDQSRPWAIFPSLDKLGMAIDVDATAICSSSLQWGESDTLAAVKSIDLKKSLTKGDLDYLSSWFGMKARGQLPYLGTKEVQKALVNKLRGALITHGLASVRGVKTSFMNVVASLADEYRIGLGTQDAKAAATINENTFRALWRVESDLLLVPADLLIGECKSERNEYDLAAWLNELQPLLDNDADGNSAMLAAKALLEMLDLEKRKSFLSSHSTLRIITSRNIHTQKDQPLSWSELNDLKQQYALFSYGAVGREAPILKSLAEALPKQELFQLTNENREVIFGQKERLPAPEDHLAILKCVFGSDSPLGKTQARKKLIESLSISQDGYRAREVRLGMRYLLHANSVNRNDDSYLWLRDNGTAAVWQKLWHAIEQTHPWQVIDESISGILKPNDYESLGIHRIDKHEAIKSLKRKGISKSIGHDFESDEREEILGEIEDEETWKGLPFHAIGNDRFVSIANGVYLQGDVLVPVGLRGQVILVQPAKVDKVHRQQVQWISELTPEVLAKLALDVEDPAEYWKLILDVFASRPSLDANDKLKRTPWLPLRNGQSIAPCNVMHIEGLEDDLERLASATSYRFATPKSMPDEIRRHDGFKRLQTELFPKGDDAFKAILSSFEGLPDYSIGVIPTGVSNLIEQALPALSKIDKLPGWKLLAAASRQLGNQAWNLLTNLKMTPLSFDDLIEILNDLAEQAHLSEKSAAFTAHRLYLHSLANHPDCQVKHIARLKLRTKGNSWKLAEELCSGAVGIPEEFLLCDEHRQALGQNISVADDVKAHETAVNSVEAARFDTLLQTAPGIARDYFRGWELRTKSTAIGTLLAILGKSFQDIARDYLGKTESLEHVRKKLSGFTDQGVFPNASPIGKSIESVKVVLDVLREGKIKIQTLLGTIRSFPIERDPEMIVVGAPMQMPNRPGVFKIKLLPPVHFTNLDGPQLSEALRRTTRHLMRVMHGSNQDTATDLWRELNQSEQLEIEITKRKILDSLPVYLQQLGAHHRPPIKPIHRLVNEAQEHFHTTEYRNDSQSDRDKARNTLKKRIEDLAKCISSDPDAQAIVLERMRSKLAEYQYEPDDILFELFQNADDAAVELGRCESIHQGEIVVPEAARRFIMQADGQAVRILHWGRPINYRGPHGLSDQWSGFGDDLEKILILAASDKPDDDSTTGRFGLGFKSVFLVCDQPRIISGDLRIKIQGSILPEHWSDADTAIKLLQVFTIDRNHRGTLIELDVVTDKRQTVIERFRQHSGLLSIFARAIRQIDCIVETNNEEVAWRPKKVSKAIEVGEASLPISAGGTQSTTLMVIRIDQSAVAIMISPHGCEVIKDNVSPIWVTAPTRETDNIGFVINGTFVVDPGRGRLAGNTQNNKKKLESMGRDMGKHLAELYLSSAQVTEWKSLRTSLGLVDECTQPQFWNSLWLTLSERTITKADSDLSKMIGELVCNAFKAWIETGAPVPNGLKDHYAALAPKANKYRQIDKAWNHPDVLKELDALGVLGEHGHGNSVLVSPFMADLIRQSGLQAKLATLNADVLISESCWKNQCTPELASALESVARALEEQESHFEISENMEIRFQVANGDWVTAQEVLCAGKSADFNDERLRYDFAPDVNRLDAAYEAEQATAFFVRFRGNMQANVKTLAKWALAAKDHSRKCAALQYVASGELGRDVADEVRGQGWIADALATDNALLVGFDDETKEQITRALMSREHIQHSVATSLSMVDSLPILTAKQGKAVMLAIHEWWQAESNTHRTQYLKHLYPGGELKGLSLADGEIDRTAWMTLFSIGAFQRLGRVRHFQTKGFIEHMQRKSWWQVVCEKHPEQHSDAWLQILKQFAEDRDNGQHYDYWLDTFPRLYQLANWLEKYVDLFEGIRLRTNQQLSPDLFLKPMTDPALQGGGWGAPPIDRTMKMGVHLVCRELLRNKVIENPHAHRLAYMPAARVVRLFEAIGIHLQQPSSEEIWKKLNEVLGPVDASFGGDFDIPLLVLAEDKNLLRKVCNAEIDDQDGDDGYDNIGIFA
jgi:hypothetical protein